MRQVNQVNQKKKQNNQNIHLRIIRLQEIFYNNVKLVKSIFQEALNKKIIKNTHLKVWVIRSFYQQYIFSQKKMYQYEELLLKLRVNSINKPQRKSFGEFILLLNNQNNYKIRIQTSNYSRNY
ncbi:unnamed protein product [Paramecium primaurelia]|uniref:Uncharacterized protein n=1 Tax=Paramecium primaurelia TaxID=5886 RepID=A0A8S1JN03_PARPR|nr:unnamed protein product [Paramecium primaurelia]